MKTFKLEFEVNDTGMLHVKSENDGFGAFELLGLLHWKIRDIGKQIQGDITPDIVSRKVIKD